MCASEALIQARMGLVTDAKSKPLLYDPNKSDYTIKEGIIVAKNKKVFDVCSNRIQTKLKKSIPTLHAEIISKSG